MRSRIAAPCSIVALAMTVLLPAQNGHAAKIIGFEAPGAATTTSTFCATACGTIALANNAEGAIVGYYTDPNVVPHGFVRSPDGHIPSFDAPGAGLGANLNQGTVAYSINDWGLIAGEFEDTSNVFHGFLRYPDGSFTTFDAPGAGRGAFLGTQPFNVNVEGASAGIYFDDNGTEHGFVRSSHGEITTIDPPGSVGNKSRT